MRVRSFVGVVAGSCALVLLGACGDCGGGGGEDGGGRDTHQPGQDAAGSDTGHADAAGTDTWHADTASADQVVHDTYQPPVDAAGQDSASGTDASTCPTRVCDGVCCSSSEVCSLFTGACCAGDCTGKDCGDDGCGTTCGTCTGQMCDGTQHCVAISTPANDSCAGAIALSFDGDDVATVHGDTVGATGDSSTYRCGLMPGDAWAGGKDVVYTFTLEAETPMTFSLRYADSTAPMLYVTTACPNQTGNELFCSAPTDLPVASRHQRMQAGTYFVWVDSRVAGAGGPFTLVVSKDPVPANDTCDGAQVLDVSSGHVSVPIDITDAVNDYSGTCASATSSDLVYRFTTSSTRQLVARVSAASPMVYLRRACESSAPADEVTCAYASGYQGSATATVYRLPAGTYFVVVEASATSGASTLELTLSDPPNVPDDCTSAQTLALDASGHVVVQPDLAQASDDMAPAGCGGTGPGNDVVYKLHLDETRNVHLTVSGYNAQVYVRTDCASTAPADELVCELVSEAVYPSFARLAAGDYWIWLDQPAAGGAAVSLRVDAVAPPAGEACGDAQPLTFTGWHAEATVDPAGAFDDYEDACASSDTGDTVYSFTLQQDSTVMVSADFGGVGGNHALYLRSDCESDLQADQVGCGYGVAPTAFAALTAGTYHVIVESGGTPFTLAVDVLQAPANDTCAGAISIEVGQSVHGVNMLASDDYGTDGLGAACDGMSANGPDLVYAFAPTTRGFYQVAHPYGSYFVWLTPTCGSASDCLAHDESGPFELEAGSTTYLVVDSYDGQPLGSFEFTLQAVASPANDTCAGALPITLDGEVHGTNVAAHDDYGSSGVAGICTSGVYDGGDVVYAFVAPATATYSLGLSCYEATPWVTTSCGSAAHCVGDSSTGWTFDGTSGTTYYIIVDSWAGYPGCEFDLGVYQN